MPYQQSFEAGMHLQFVVDLMLLVHKIVDLQNNYSKNLLNHLDRNLKPKLYRRQNRLQVNDSKLYLLQSHHRQDGRRLANPLL